MSELAAKWKTISGRDYGEHLVQLGPLEDVHFAEAKTLVASQVADVRFPAEVEIVEAADFVAAGQELIAEMAADESRAARYQYTHVR